MADRTFNFQDAIRSARRQVAQETAVHEKRMEFWTGYITAMEEVESHIGEAP